MNPFQTKKFKAIQDRWYEKLKKQGFEDIEDVTSKNEFLKTWHSSYFQKKYNPEVFNLKKEYYDWARSLLQTHLREGSSEFVIWEMHSEGLSIREIALRVNMKVCQVYKVMTTLKKKGLKKIE